MCSQELWHELEREAMARISKLLLHHYEFPLDVRVLFHLPWTDLLVDLLVGTLSEFPKAQTRRLHALW